MNKSIIKALMQKLLITLALFFPSLTTADLLNSILERGTVKIGVPENFPPFGSVGANFEHEGYDVDVAKLIAKDLGVKLDLVPITSKQRIPFLQSGKLDLVVSSMGANPSRAKSIWFSSAYAPFYSGVFAATNKNISNASDLLGIRTGVTGGTIEDLALSELITDETKLIRFGDNAANLSAYLSGQTDAIVTGNTVAAKLAQDNPDLNLEIKFILRESPCFIGLKSGEANLLQWINVFVLHKKLGGDLNEFSKKWFKQPLPPLPTF